MRKLTVETPTTAKTQLAKLRIMDFSLIRAGYTTLVAHDKWDLDLRAVILIMMRKMGPEG